MSENLKICLKNLDYISKIKCKKTQYVLLKYFSNNSKMYLALKEIATNLIKGNLNMSFKAKRNFKKHKKNIYKLANCKNNPKLFQQSGGWISLFSLLPLLYDVLK